MMSTPDPNEVVKLLEQGYSPYQVAVKMGYGGAAPVQHIIKNIGSVLDYDKWECRVLYRSSDPDAGRMESSYSCISREVLVMKTLAGYETIYFSMTAGGSHSRLVSRTVFPNSELALSEAKSIRERYN